MAIVFAPLKILDEVASDIYASTKKALAVTKDALVRNLEIGFSSYLNKRYERYSKVHTLLSPNEPVNIEDIYVNPKLTHKGGVLLGEHSIDFILERRVLVTQAIAGHGKSMFVRELFCRLCKLNYGVIPVFLELRDVDFSSTDVVGAAFDELSGKSSGAQALFARPAFDALVKSGKVLFLLDGFDEVTTAERKSALAKIDQITRDFPAARVVVTSRPTDIFNGWNLATIIKIKDYDLHQIIELIERSPIKSDIKDVFRAKVESEYIRTHIRFLANPLLCNMMILTFMRGGDIPQQKHIFYRKAFDTLYRHHDDMKFLYKRDYHSDLQEDVFVRLWRSFCYFSYSERKFSFEIDSLKKFITRAAEYLSISVDIKATAEDFIESLCIIVKDGDQHSFLHRSFQEYGAATFLCTERVGKPVFNSLSPER
ncbi:hypothetical protein [Mesorhizobium sp.]|uniref:NACHT domain-containing protein n=1 Tax=Mesorhizobium sp. TaxID=1871066 RepID=UPI000FE5F3BF|nr:hypothetical protein [Mesorhizobium sp.]RWG01644.1 MAG: hypothetical protein EOQ54_22595 [Mesorhizobium sp.]RWG97342.1 MAG: hypothetical protein EOQ72_19185 [Mesorhizobium sp.]TIN36627.1 MAG: hypothetical protein E5Y25_23445 [Mesorhizobium sp.]TIR91736.1 MAG: hypothetical protein E5X08_17440 [Mesorhizobium sp.]TIS00765.1 MAG: hypothetical protein E5X13_17105 [Mesorhizobium sp.]